MIGGGPYGGGGGSFGGPGGYPMQRAHSGEGLSSRGVGGGPGGDGTGSPRRGGPSPGPSKIKSAPSEDRSGPSPSRVRRVPSDVGRKLISSANSLPQHAHDSDDEGEGEEDIGAHVEPMRTDFHFYARDRKEAEYESARRDASQYALADRDGEGGDKKEDDKEKVDPYLVNTLLNERLMAMWEAEPKEVRLRYFGREEADRLRFINEDEIAARHCETKTARSTRRTGSGRSSTDKVPPVSASASTASVKKEKKESTPAVTPKSSEDGKDEDAKEDGGSSAKESASAAAASAGEKRSASDPPTPAPDGEFDKENEEEEKSEEEEERGEIVESPTKKSRQAESQPPSETD